MIWSDFFMTHGLVLEMVLSTALFTWHMERQNHFAARIIGTIALLMGVSLLLSTFMYPSAPNRMLQYILLFTLCVFAISFCFQVKRNVALFYATAMGIVQHFSFKAARTSMFLLFHATPPSLATEFFTYPTLFLLFLLLCYLLFARRMKPEDINTVHLGSVAWLLIGLLLFVNLFQNLFNEYSTNISVELYTLFELFDLVCCLFFLSLQCEICRRKKAEQDNVVLKQILYLQKEQMKNSKETIDLINIKCHDLKNQLMTLGNRIPQDEIDELYHTISIYDAFVKTENETLDILLAEKLLLCENKHISFDYMVDGKALSFMKPSDIYSLFGNAIDNAIEAVDKISETDRRYIDMKVVQNKGMLMIHLENCYDGEIRFQDHLPQTTKKDKRYHGFGMKSIRLITEKYHGYLKVSAQNQLFTLNILFPLASG